MFWQEQLLYNPFLLCGIYLKVHLWCLFYNLHIFRSKFERLRLFFSLRKITSSLYIFLKTITSVFGIKLFFWLYAIHVHIIPSTLLEYCCCFITTRITWIIWNIVVKNHCLMWKTDIIFLLKRCVICSKYYQTLIFWTSLKHRWMKPHSRTSNITLTKVMLPYIIRSQITLYFNEFKREFKTLYFEFLIQ
jgi:hypothetical protein